MASASFPERATSFGATSPVVLVDYDGSLNTTFNTNIQTLLGLGVSATPYPLQDGTAWLLGPNLTRINATGQKVAGHTDYDTSNPSTVLHFAHALKSGKLLVGLRNSGSTREFKLFNTNGTFDSAFNTANLTLNNAIGIAAEQADGKIVVGGNFTSYGSNACNGRIMRINADGTFDSTFYNAAGFSTAGVTGMAYDPRGYVYLAAPWATPSAATSSASSPPPRPPAALRLPLGRPESASRRARAA